MPKELTPRQLKAIEALTTCAEVSKAAEMAGVSRDTLYRWMRNETFKDALNASVSQAVERISRSLISLGERAVEALAKAMTAPDVPINTSIRAADIVLSRLLQVYEMADLESRVNQLERRKKDETKTTY